MAQMEKINWDHFPEPFNRELPFYIDKAFQRLSPGGVEMLNEMFCAGAYLPVCVMKSRLPHPRLWVAGLNPCLLT